MLARVIASLTLVTITLFTFRRGTCSANTGGTGKQTT